MKTPYLRHRAPGSLFALLAISYIVTLYSASASTVAQWRFEEGPAGSSVAYPQIDAVWDSSGNGNHLRTWADYTTPTYTTDTPFHVVPATGDVNDYALSFANGSRDLYTAGKPINTHAFEALTIEVSFKLNDAGRIQVIVGKDGNLTDGAPALAIKFRRDEGLQFFMVDSSNELRSVETEEPIRAGVWYSVAATATASEMSLWVQWPDESEYTLEGTAEVNGLFPVEDTAWTIGRSMWNGRNLDFFDGSIDEVRISDAVLDPSEFLGVYPGDTTTGQGTLLELSLLDAENRSDGDRWSSRRGITLQQR
jgi:hypothetical protein